jgi:hypothetical protein
LARFLGLDWDNNQLHLVAVSTGRGGVHVERAVVWQEDFSPAPGRAEAVGQRLREHLRTAGIAPAPVLIGLGRERVILKEIRYPAVPASEEPAVVRFQAAKELTETGEGMVIDYAPRGLSTPGGEKCAFAFAVRRDVTLFLQAACRAAGLKLLAITARGFGVAACLKRSAATPAETVEAVLTVAGTWTDFSVVRGETLLFSRSLPSDGNLLLEVRRNLAVYNGQAAAADKAQALYVAGSEAPGLLDDLRRTLGIAVHPLDPFARDERLQPTGERGGYTGAVGLTAAWAAHRKLPANFIQPKEPVKQSDPETRKAIQVAALAGFILLGVIVICWMLLNNRRAELDNLLAQESHYDAQLRNLEPDAKHILALREWTNDSVSWLDELYEVTARFDYREGFRLTSFKGDIKPPPLAVFGKPKPKEKYIGQLVLSGEVPASEDRLVDHLKEALKDATHSSDLKSHGNPTGNVAAKKNTKTFTLNVGVVPQPSVGYVNRFDPPARTGRQPDAIPALDGFE